LKIYCFWFYCFKLHNRRIVYTLSS